MNWFDIIKLEEITKASALTEEDEKKIADRMKFRNETREAAEKAVRRETGKIVTDTRRSISDRVRGVLSNKDRGGFHEARRQASKESRLRHKSERPPNTRLRPKTNNQNTRTRLRPKPTTNKYSNLIKPKGNLRPKTNNQNVRPAPDLDQMVEDNKQKKIRQLTQDLEFQAQ